MKTLKRILAMTLAIMMVMGLSVAAFADGTADGTTYYCGKEAHTHDAAECGVANPHTHTYADMRAYAEKNSATTEITDETTAEVFATWLSTTGYTLSDDQKTVTIPADKGILTGLCTDACYTCGKVAHTHVAACEVPPLGSITIGNPQTTGTGDTAIAVAYKAYQIFELSYEETNKDGVPVPPKDGNPYTYYIDLDSPWCEIVVEFAKSDDKIVDHDNNPTTAEIKARGLILDPVYDTKGDLIGYDVTSDNYYDPAAFAEKLKDSLKLNVAGDGEALTAEQTAANEKIQARLDTAKSFNGNKLEGLPFGYYLVDPSVGALASLTSTDPDVVVTDKNEEPKVDKVIVEDHAVDQKLYGLGTYEVEEGGKTKIIEGLYKYEAYEIFHKTDANIEWGRDVNASAFSTALVNDTDLDELFNTTYGEPTYTEDPGDTVAHKWFDLYKGKNDANIEVTKDDFIDAANTDGVLKDTSSNALNPVNAGSTYLVKMSKLKDNTTDEYEVVGYDIVTAPAAAADSTTGTSTLPLSSFSPVDGGEEVDYEEPQELADAELKGIDNEVKANGASIGETVNFKLTTKVPDMTGYNDYFFVVNDVMSKGLTFDGEDSVKVKLDGEELTQGKDQDYTVQINPVYELDPVTKEKIPVMDPNDETKPLVDENNNTVYKTTGETEVRIIFRNMLQYWNADPAEDQTGAPIVITYSATVNQNAEVTAPETNTALIEYSNDPTLDVEYTPDTDPETPDDDPTYDPRDTEHYKTVEGGALPTDVVGEGPDSKTYTYISQITLTKVDSGDNPLSGAKFKITGEEYQVVLFENTIYKADDNGTWYLLKDGTYTQTAPSDKVEVAYEEYTKDIVTKERDTDQTIKAGKYYLDDSENPAEYKKIGTGTGETPVGDVPTDAVMYIDMYTYGLYIAQTVPDGGWPAGTAEDAKYQAVSATVDESKNETEAQKIAELLENDPDTKFYVRNTTTNKDNYEEIAKDQYQMYSQVTELVNKDTDSAPFQFEGYTDENGLLTFTGLGEGTYTIEELIAPEGYNLLQAPITVVIKFTENSTPSDGGDYGEFSARVDEAEADTSYDATTNTISFNVINNKGTELPETGGIGTYIFYALGGLIVVGAGVLLITRKRMSEEE